MYKKIGLITALLMGCHAGAMAQAPEPVNTAAKATFSGGNFIYLEPAFQSVPGVVSVVVGYTGGMKKNPTYSMVTGGHTGYYEAVEVTYDSSKVSYDQLLDAFWQVIDPLDEGGQFCDRGKQYISSIVVRDAKQLAAAEAAKQKVSQKFGTSLATIIRSAMEFYPAEEYFQHFYYKYPDYIKQASTHCGRDARLQELWHPPVVR